MPTKTLSPNRFIAVRYELPKEAGVSLDLDSDLPVKTYFVRPKGLDAFRDGSKSFKYYGGFPEPRMHQHQTVWLPHPGPWYLIISNPDKSREADVQYEVSY
jgi:hypothetical protein